MKDVLGRDLKVGDTIVYTVRRGSSVNLTKAVVTEVSEGSAVVKPQRGYVFAGQRPTVTLRRPYYIVNVSVAVDPAPYPLEAAQP